MNMKVKCNKGQCYEGRQPKTAFDDLFEGRNIVQEYFREMHDNQNAV